MTEWLPYLIRLAGVGQLAVLAVAFWVPAQLNWSNELKTLSRLHRQMHWTYGGYIAASIGFFSLVSLTCSHQLVESSGIAQLFCAYVTLFWGVRLAMQAILDIRVYLTRRWHIWGYHALTVAFASFTLVFGWATIHPLL